MAESACECLPEIKEEEKDEVSLIVLYSLSKEQHLWELLAGGDAWKRWTDCGFGGSALAHARAAFLKEDGNRRRRRLEAAKTLHDMLQVTWSPTECVYDAFLKGIRETYIERALELRRERKASEPSV